MKINVIKENKIIRQENEGYIAKEGEILLSANDIDWPILKRTGGQFLEINKDDKLENDIISGGVVRFKVKRNNEIIEIKKEEKEETDVLLEFIYPENMIRVYRGGISVLTIGTDFDPNTEAIEHKYTKDELYILNSKAQIKTPEMQIDDIRIKANIVLDNYLDEIEILEKAKIRKQERDDWYDIDEQRLQEKITTYQNALNDYNEVKLELLENSGSLEEIKLAKEKIKPILLKYNIRV